MSRLVQPKTDLGRFVVFVHDTYYPAGGLNDKVGSTNTRDEAIHLLSQHNGDYAQIWDTSKDVVTYFENSNSPLYGVDEAVWVEQHD